MVVVLALVTWRVYVLLERDRVLEAPRTWLEDRLPEWGKYLLHCPFCLGTWIALALTLASIPWLTIPWPLAWGAAAAGAALIETRLA
jgi:hypothetical protein